MNKITPEHLTRGAYVYVRQSSPDQLINNPESRRRHHYSTRTECMIRGWSTIGFCSA